MKDGVIARTVRVECLTAATPGGLAAAVADFLAALGEGILLDVQYEVASPSLFTALVLYTR